ncbi:MobQ family relaxase [Paenisporosarcina sp. OV554]|uniref:MobQ family relaxase n=1 Tax=Paenisporosarcina sp. OV554 TaxID=2135694 RepID=UPI000D34E956|nr:MobQ family relaxase [Paenisporosarcina sp. OV554]PUB12213.1 MobA/MobL family protein [Paenisporosarcina sp. OV554]
MSYYMLRANVISKKTQSVVASASYRSGMSLYSERDEEIKNFRTRGVAPETFILKPDHAPEWTLDREKLWNEVETKEKAWNAQLAREVLIALPLELNHDQQKRLVETFVQTHFVDEGMVADVAIHRDKEHNPHAHILLTVRPFKEDGTWGEKKRRVYERDERREIKRTNDGKKIFQTVSSTDWNHRETLVKWRLAYAETINDSFLENDINQKVSALSFEDQGLEKIAEVRLERNEYQYVKRLEAQGKEATTFYHQLNQEIRKTNQEISRLESKIVSLAAHQSTPSVEKLLHLETSLVMSQLEPEYMKSIHFLQGRLKQEVNFTNVRQHLDGLYRWRERTLEPKETEMTVTHALLDAVNKAYHSQNKDFLQSQVFSMDRFYEQFVPLLETYEDTDGVREKEAKIQDMLLEHTERVYNVWSLITHRTFNEVFPDLAEEFKWNDRVLLTKSDMLEALKQNKLEQVPYPEEVSEVLAIAEIEQLVVKSDTLSNTIRIQSLTRNKLGKEKDALIKMRGEPEKVYQLSIKVNTMQQLLTQSSRKAELVNEQLGVLLRHTFADEKESTLKKLDDLPFQVKADILRSYKDDLKKGFIPSLRTCVRFATARETERADKQQAYEKTQHNSFFNRLSTAQRDISHFVGGRASSELLEQLIFQSSSSHASKQSTNLSSKLKRKTKNQRIRQLLDLEVDL